MKAKCKVKALVEVEFDVGEELGDTELLIRINELAEDNRLYVNWYDMMHHQLNVEV